MGSQRRLNIRRVSSGGILRWVVCKLVRASAARAAKKKAATLGTIVDDSATSDSGPQVTLHRTISKTSEMIPNVKDR